MSSRHGVGHLPCHTVSDVIEPKLLFSVLYLFTAPEGVQEGFITFTKNILDIYFLFQPNLMEWD